MMIQQSDIPWNLSFACAADRPLWVRWVQSWQGAEWVVTRRVEPGAVFAMMQPRSIELAWFAPGAWESVAELELWWGRVSVLLLSGAPGAYRLSWRDELPGLRSTAV